MAVGVEAISSVGGSSAIGRDGSLIIRMIAAGGIAIRRAIKLRRCECVRKTALAALSLRADGGFFRLPANQVPQKTRRLGPKPVIFAKTREFLTSHLSPSQKHGFF
jgi:hypothetical protein